MSANTPVRRRPRPSSDTELFPEVLDQDPSDRILRDEGCALLGVRVDTFRDQYLTPERRAASIRRFGIARDDRRRVTVSRRLVLEHLAAVTREPWGGAYGPPGLWAERVRQAAKTSHDSRDRLSAHNPLPRTSKPKFSNHASARLPPHLDC